MDWRRARMLVTLVAIGFPLSPRIHNLKGIIAKMRPARVRAIAPKKQLRATASHNNQICKNQVSVWQKRIWS